MTRPRNVVVLCTDARFVLPCAFVLNQLSSDPAAGAFDMVVVHDGLNPADTARLEHGVRRPVTTIDFRGSASRLSGVHTTAQLSRATYMRLLLHELLPPHYDRILYLDSDLWLEQPGIARLFELDLAGAPFAAGDDGSSAEMLCLDALPGSSHAHYKGMTREAYRAGLGIAPGDAYCNAGVLLIDRARWTEERIPERALDFALSRPESCLNADQSAINAVARGRWAHLSPRYNFQAIHGLAGIEDVVRPVVWHFAGPYKPWNTPIWGERFTQGYHAWQTASGWPGAFPAGPVPDLPAPARPPAARGPWARWRRRLFGAGAPAAAAPETASPAVGRRHRALFRRAVYQVMSDARFIDLAPAEAERMRSALVDDGRSSAAVRGK